MHKISPAGGLPEHIGAVFISDDVRISTFVTEYKPTVGDGENVVRGKLKIHGDDGIVTACVECEGWLPAKLTMHINK